MSTTVSPQEHSSETLSVHQSHSHSGKSTTRRPRSRWPIGLLLFGVVVVAAAVYAGPKMIEGWAADTAKNLLTHEVQRGELLVTVTEDGNVESASNIEIRCQVAGGSSILTIVEDGTQVKKGDLLVELDSSALEDQINTQRIAFERVRATKIQSEKNWSVAKISVTEYLEGTYKQSLQDAEAQITIAEENLRSSKNSLEHSEKMFRKGYVSSLELEGQKFAVQRSELELASAKTAKDVLEKFTKEKTLEDLQSQRDNAEAQMKADASAFDLEKTRLDRLEAQLANCKMFAPQSGMVVYANDRGGRFGPSEAAVEEGAAVRERQVILRLPDLEKMQVKVTVHESKVDQIRSGMRARIRILDSDLTGAVTTIMNQPEPSSFMSANVKEYATTVRIIGQPDALRPGMTAEVEILVAHLKDVLSLPVAAVVEQRGKFFCWVDTPSGPERRPLVLGHSNDQFVEVKDGVSQGEQVLINPRAVVKEARSDDEESEEINVNEKFGDAPLGPGPGDPSEMQRGDRGGPGDAGGRRGRPGAEGDGGGMERPRREGGAGGGGGGRGGGGFNLMQFDADGDGKVSKDEVPERMQGFFDRLDGNGDGFIDNSEISEMRRQAQEGGVGSGGGRPGGGGPGGGGGFGGPPGN